MATATLHAATLPQAETLTLEQYLKTSYQPDVDFVDDHIEERQLGERPHSILQIAIGAWFYNRRQEWQITVMAEQRTRVSASRVRLPDVCLIPKSAPKEQVTTTPPLVAIEILSPEDRLSRVLSRLDEFLAMGVPHIWLIDPTERTAFTYSATGLKLVSGPRIALPDSPIHLDLTEIFFSLD